MRNILPYLSIADVCLVIFIAAEFLCVVLQFQGGKKFCTTVGTLTQREPDSMLAAMFSGRHTLCQDSEKVYTTVMSRHLNARMLGANIPALMYKIP